MKRPITKIDMRNIDPDWLRHAHEERLARQGGRSTPDNGTAARGADGGRGEDRGRPVADGPRKKGAKKVQFPRTKSVENVISFQHFELSLNDFFILSPYYWTCHTVATFLTVPGG